MTLLQIIATPSRQGKSGANKQDEDKKNKEPPVGEHQEMTWAQRLKRVFNIDVTTCSRCVGSVKIIACIDDLAVTKKILDHLGENSRTLTSVNQLP